MTALLVVENMARWPLKIPGAEIVLAQDYLTNPKFLGLRRARVFNLCRTYTFQTVGYYVSLLAEARGHRPLPSVTTVHDLRQAALLKVAEEDMEQLIERRLKGLQSSGFVLSIYFGRNLAKRYDALAQALFDHFPAPLLRAEFAKEGDRWRLDRLRPVAFHDIPESHRDFVVEQAQRFFARPRRPGAKKAIFDLAILVDPQEVDSPSDDKAVRKFERAAQSLGVRAWVIDKNDYGRIAEFDALFIRETTGVDHHTYRFARRAEAEGLVVIDDSQSIIRCTNKVYQAELFDKHGVACPKTLVVHAGNADRVEGELGFPCVLKRPDSSFSAGVVKAKDAAELRAKLTEFFELSELVVAQEFVKSDFDWRIGVLDGEALFVCKYYMARGHWQIQKAQDETRRSYGKVESVPVADAPAGALELGVRAARLIGRGLYGVDVKEVDGRFVVMEVNDNPNIDAGYEDGELKDKLYTKVIEHFCRRVAARGDGQQ